MNTVFSFLAIPKQWAGDLSFLLAFLGVSLILGFVFGRMKLLNILIDAYIAFALTSALPHGTFDTSPPYADAAFFFVMLAFLVAVDSHLFDVHISNAGTDIFWRLVVMSLLVAGTITSILLALMPKSLVKGIVSPDAYGVFAGGWTLIIWLILPLISLLLINKRLR